MVALEVPAPELLAVAKAARADLDGFSVLLVVPVN